MEDVCVEPVDSDIEIAIRSRDEMESSGGVEFLET